MQQAKFDINSLMKEVKHEGDPEEFKEAFGIEKEEHSELDDLTVAHIAADHLRKDPEYYEKEEVEDDDEEFKKENDSDKEDSEDMVNIYNSLKSKGKED